MQFNHYSFKKRTSKLYLQPQAVLDKVNSMMKKHELPSLHSAVDSLSRKQSRTQLSVMSIPLAPSTKTIFGWSHLSYHHLFCQHFPEHQIDVLLFVNMTQILSWSQPHHQPPLWRQSCCSSWSQSMIYHWCQSWQPLQGQFNQLPTWPFFLLHP